MSNEYKKLSFLRQIKEKLLEEKKLKLNDDIIQFYQDSTKLSNVTDGMVVIIGDGFTILSQRAIGKESHQIITQEIFDDLAINKGIEPVDFKSINGDFGEIIPQKYNYIFIRMASLLNGPTIIYYPEKCSEYQIKKMEEFNSKIKRFNEENKKDYKVQFEYNGRNDEIVTYDLDNLIIEIKNHNKNHNK